LILLSSALEFNVKKNIKMNKLIIDAAKENIFLMIISNIGVYNITHTNSKTNYEKLIILINDFLQLNNLHINDISFLYVNRGPGSFAGIRNSLSIIKALHLIKKIDYYCYSIEDFKGEDNIKHENIPDLCDKFKVKKNLIKPIYIS
jgi:hypothetical protein|tara:strand:- start:198 stop:635 length:438 start_codon:yes stop_codon:yes gene_type:complete